MSPLRLMFVVAGLGLLMAGFLSAQTEPSPASQPPATGAVTGAVTRSKPAEPAAAAGTSLASRVAELERHVAALETRYAALQRKFDKIQDLQTKVHSIEELHAKAEAEIESLHTSTRTRFLNPTEFKETSDLVNRRLKNFESKMSQLMREQREIIQTLPATVPAGTHDEDETPYGP